MACSTAPNRIYATAWGWNCRRGRRTRLFSMSEPPRSAQAQHFRTRLLRWFEANRRDLPWRRSRDPWGIWVSEIMLQQTRVEAVRTAYERFMARFPTPASFAAATDDDL